ncbi:hypothetical protein [Paenibacillus sp. WLX2291]|uniref:hypothetical protein n=1 Tax=Paenibacillus sp. WLX2291 TaxID=3296934 RepID=UPI003984109A
MSNKSWRLSRVTIVTICVIGTCLILFSNFSQETKAATKQPSVVEGTASTEEMKQVKDNVSTIYAGDYYYNVTTQSTNNLPTDQVAHGVENVTDKTILIIMDNGKTYIRAGKAE